MRRTDPIPAAKHASFLFLAPAKDQAYELDLQRLKARGYKVTVIVPSATPSIDTMRRITSLLCDPYCLGLILPDDYHRHTEPIERAKVIARHIGLLPLPLTRYTQQTTPTAAVAVPATQQRAAVG